MINFVHYSFIDPIDCSYASICHLSWLIVDEPELLNLVKDGQCSNGTLFNELDKDGFKTCPYDITLATEASSGALISAQSPNVIVFHLCVISLLGLNLF